MDVGDWLSDIGLDQYESVFLEHEIDGSVLPDLTDGDFEKLGVPMGHRKRLLKAISTLGATTAVVQHDRPAPQSSTDAAERRQLTMFCDLVGSTAMSAGLDPEDMRSVIGAYHRCSAALIAGGNGFVAKYMGDNVLAFFGYPQAHEHDAEHAVRAGLAIVEAAPKLDTPAGAPLHPANELAPPQRRQKTLEAFDRPDSSDGEQNADADDFRGRPLADPSRLEVLSQLVDAVQGMRALLFVTFRPEFAVPWVGRPHVTTLSI